MTSARTRRAAAAALAAAALLVGAAPGRAQAPAGEAPPPAGPPIATAGQPVKGEQTARLTIVEFSDYQCPFCGRFQAETFPSLEEEYIRTGKVRYVFRDFPLEAIHPEALKAAEAAHCAGDQGKYWEMHDRLFADQQALGPHGLKESARAIGLDATRFDGCLDGATYTARVRESFAVGRRAGVRGTPTFFVGYTEGDGAPLTPRAVIRGAYPYETFKDALDNLLAAAGQP